MTEPIFKKVINKTKNTVLAEKAEIADTPSMRIKGLLGKDNLKQGTGLVIVPCSSIHTFFMRFSIDVLFLDRQNRVVKIARSLLPGRIFGSFLKGKLAIELPIGTLDKTNTKVSDLVEII